MFRYASFLFLLGLFGTFAFAQEPDLVGYWPFDREASNTTADLASHTTDGIAGNFAFVPGVHGEGVKFDGFTTRIVRSSYLPEIAGGATFAAWIAPQAYPWNWNAIVEQENRYFFGIDATGHIGLRVLLEGQWRECVSDASIPFMQWSYVAATFDPQEGLRVYIDGRLSGASKIGGHLAHGGSAFQIGRNLHDIPAASSIKIPASYSFDGILDELKIYSRALDAAGISQQYDAMRPSAPPALTWRKLPKIPDGQKHFGAYYTSLKFYPEWDQLWRVDEYPDLIVTFDNAPYKMVFWHGTTYNMNLVTENGRWVGDQSAEAPPSQYGCIEHMSDKQARYSHVRLIENSPARVVVHWRYALTDVLYNIGEPDPITGWGDWADEYYTIYPDGIAIRHFLVHAPSERYSITEPATLNNPGEKAEDNVSIQAATLANMNGESRTFSWEKWPSSGAVRGHFFNEVPEANIAIVNIKSAFKPLYIYEPGTLIIPYGGGEIERSPFSKFPVWNHWPVAQIPSDGRNALAVDRVSSSAILSPEPPMAKRANDGAVEGRFIMGLTNQPITAALALARSWLDTPELKVARTQFANDGYSRDDRAYHLHRESGREGTLQLSLEANTSHPAENPAFVIEGWGQNDIALKINGRLATAGKDYRVGHVEKLGGTSLVLWIGRELTESTRIDLSSIK